MKTQHQPLYQSFNAVKNINGVKPVNRPKYYPCCM